MFTIADNVLDAKVIAACDRLLVQFGQRVNLTGVDVGFAWRKGRQTRQIALRLHVITKIPPKFLHRKARFPQQFDGYQVDVMEACCNGASTFVRPDGQSWSDWFDQATLPHKRPENSPRFYQTPEQFQRMFTDLMSLPHTRLPTQHATSPDASQVSLQWPSSPDKVLPCLSDPFQRMEPCQDRTRPNYPPVKPPLPRNWTAERMLAKLGQVQIGGNLGPEHRQTKNAVALMQKVSLMAFIWPNLKNALFVESPCFRELLPETPLSSFDLPEGPAEWIATAVNFWPAFERLSLQVPAKDLVTAVDFMDVLTSLHRQLRKLGYEVV